MLVPVVDVDGKPVAIHVLRRPEVICRNIAAVTEPLHFGGTVRHHIIRYIRSSEIYTSGHYRIHTAYDECLPA